LYTEYYKSFSFIRKICIISKQVHKSFCYSVDSASYQWQR